MGKEMEKRFLVLVLVPVHVFLNRDIFGLFRSRFAIFLGFSFFAY